MGVGDSFHGGEINGCEGKCTIESFDSDGLDFAFTPVSDTSALHPLTMIVAQVRPICMKRIRLQDSFCKSFFRRDGISL